MIRRIWGLSVTRPWPYAFKHGKRVENRYYAPSASIGDYIALHAAKSWSEEDRLWIANQTGLRVPGDDDMACGELFAVGRLAAVITSLNDPRLPLDQKDWFFGPYGWLLSEYVDLRRPVPCKGARKLWTFDDRPAELELLRQSYKLSTETVTI